MVTPFLLSAENKPLSIYGIGKGWASKKIRLFTADADDYNNQYLFADQVALTDGKPRYHHRTGERVYRVEPALRSYITKYGTANGEMPLDEVRIGETWQGVKDKGSRAVDQLTAAAEKEGALFLLGKSIFSLVSLESAKQKGMELGLEFNERGGKVFVPKAMNYGFPSDKELVDRLQGNRAAQIEHSADDALFKTEITFTVGTGFVGSVYAQAGKQVVKQGLDEITDIASDVVKQGGKGDTLVDAGDIRVGGNVPDNKGPLQIEFRDPVQLDEFNRLNQVDFAVNKARPGEASAAVEIQNAFGGKLRRAESGDGSVDFIFADGPQKGKTVDFLFTADTNKQAEFMNKFFDKNLAGNKAQIVSHVQKADLVPLDFRNLNIDNQSKITDFIKTLNQTQQSRLVIMK